MEIFLMVLYGVIGIVLITYGLLFRIGKLDRAYQRIIRLAGREIDPEKLKRNYGAWAAKVGLVVLLCGLLIFFGSGKKLIMVLPLFYLPGRGIIIERSYRDAKEE
jgi:galactitol-specific phosphotransferase system IIC component